MTGDLATELAASLTARDPQYRTLATRIDDTDRCEMPIGPGVFCSLPGDHTGGCSAPDRCKCSHAQSVHTRGGGKCWNAVCGCAQFRPPADPPAIPARFDERYDPSPAPIDRKTR